MAVEKPQYIAIDVRMAEHTGIGRYIRGTVTALKNASSERVYTLMGKNGLKNEFPPEFSYIAANIPIYSIQEQVALPWLARSADCLHSPHYNAPLFWNRKLIVTIHDLIHLHFADALASPLAKIYARFMLPAVVRRADAIIAVSEYTKNDLVKTLKVNPDKITVIHHGIDHSFEISDADGEKYPPKEPYFLYVGLIKAHKNIGILLEAFLKLRKEKNLPSLKLYLVGTPDLKQAIVREWLEMIHREPSISLMSGVDERKLKELYRNATALILPSLYEGFGFPLLEAMASQTPIIASRIASIPEVLGERAGLYFDPHSASELHACLEKILNRSDLRAQLIEEGLKRLRLFDWKVAAQKTERVYESVLGSN